MSLSCLPQPGPTLLLQFGKAFAKVVGLSYGGDIRVGLAENPHKVPHGSKPFKALV